LTLQALWILMFLSVGRAFLIKSSFSWMIHSIWSKTKFGVLDIPVNILAFHSVFIFCFHFLQYIFNISNIFGCCVIVFAYFVSIFIRVFNFVRISDRFACYSRDYHRNFVFACFLVFIASYVIYTFGLCCKLVLFGVGFSSASTARWWDERCERVRILKVFEQNTSNWKLFFYH